MSAQEASSLPSTSHLGHRFFCFCFFFCFPFLLLLLLLLLGAEFSHHRRREDRRWGSLLGSLPYSRLPTSSVHLSAPAANTPSSHPQQQQQQQQRQQQQRQQQPCTLPFPFPFPVCGGYVGQHNSRGSASSRSSYTFSIIIVILLVFVHLTSQWITDSVPSPTPASRPDRTAAFGR